MMNAILAVLAYAICSSLAQHLPVPPLPYDYNALEPWIDESTMRVHHLGHHAAYTSQLNVVLQIMRNDANTKHLAKMGIDELLHHLDDVPEQYVDVIRNAGGGYVNHDLWWKVISPWGGVEPRDDSRTIQERRFFTAIEKKYGSFSQFKESFEAAASSVFVSGWTFLYYDQQNKDFEIITVIGHDTPAHTATKVPLLLLDMWEHAYYLMHQNNRTEYISNFWKVVDWPLVSTRYAVASGEVQPEPLLHPEQREKQRVGLVPVEEKNEALSEL